MWAGAGGGRLDGSDSAARRQEESVRKDAMGTCESVSLTPHHRSDLFINKTQSESEGEDVPKVREGSGLGPIVGTATCGLGICIDES